MFSSDHAKLVSSLIFSDEQPTIPYMLTDLRIPNRAWSRVYQFSPEDSRNLYILTGETQKALAEVNDRGQPLIYILLRFCKDERFLKTILCSTSLDMFDLITLDGSTPVIGYIYENRYNLQAAHYDWIAKIVGPKRWNQRNFAGESAASIVNQYGAPAIVF
jgi:hypothetical protein